MSSHLPKVDAIIGMFKEIMQLLLLGLGGGGVGVGGRVSLMVGARPVFDVGTDAYMKSKKWTTIRRC
jgi:hypothetical protein